MAFPTNLTWLYGSSPEAVIIPLYQFMDALHLRDTIWALISLDWVRRLVWHALDDFLFRKRPEGVNRCIHN